MELYILFAGIMIGVICGHYLDEVKDYLDDKINKE